MNTNHDLLNDLVEFYRDYCMEQIQRLATGKEESLWVDFHDLYRFGPSYADDLRSQPETFLDHMEEALEMVDLPTGDPLTDVTVRVSGLNPEHIYYPGEVRKDVGGEYVGIHGILERVTTSSDLPEQLVFECQRCPNRVTIPQDPNSNEIQEPYECPGCERQGPFEIDDTHEDSNWSDYAKIRIDSRPDVDNNESGKIVGYVLNDLIDEGGDSGLAGRAGEPVTVYGIVQRVQKQGRGENSLLFDHVLETRAIEFERENETVEIERHRDSFEELASQPNAVDLFAESIAPNLHATEAWETAMEFAAAYLFGAPRIDIENGPTYRGDLHFLIISDYGMGKSDFSTDIEAYSPKCISKSTTALSSDTGLTSAAVKDDFGEGQWTIKPGLLVRANGGHLILDELDKGPDELTNMNDAIEGKQQVDVEKAGKSITYESKTGVMALGNPVDGRFNDHDAIAEQLGISDSLLSRFDGIVTMEDIANMDLDREIAQTYGQAYTEAQQAQYGDRDEFEVLDRPVPIDVGQAWVKYARENVNPILSYEQFQELEDWYAEEVRQLNATFAEDGEGQDMPVPATVRELSAAVKMSIAFARCKLQSEVKDQQIQRAKKLGKALVKQNWNGENFDATKNMASSSKKDSQQDRINEIVNECGGETLTVSEVATRVKRDFDSVRKDLRTMQGRQAEDCGSNRYEIKEIH
jgi:replicative DNA helicase Mcm